MAGDKQYPDSAAGHPEPIWAARKASVTMTRPVQTENLGEYIDKPNVPRASYAVSKEHPEGTKNRPTHGLSVMQQHVAFFDRNGDGIVYPWETYVGFRAIGFNILLSILGAIIINGAFSFSTLDGWIPSPLFPIYIKNIHKAKHGSDSEVYDTEGRFVPEKFEQIFTKYDTERKGGLTLLEVFKFTEDLRNAMDPFGWFASKLEWGLTWMLAANQDGILQKETIRRMYDGSLFEVMEQQRLHNKGKVA